MSAERLVFATGEGALRRHNSTAQACGGLPDRLLHCGISAPSADGFMAEMGHKRAYPIAAEPELMSVVLKIATDWDGNALP